MPISLVQKAFNNLNGAASITEAYPGNVTAGNLLIAIVANDAVDFGPTVVDDTQGNVWTQDAKALSLDSFADIEIWHAIAKATGANTVSWDTGGAADADLMLMIFEYSGIPNAALDQSGFKIGANPLITRVLTTTFPNELVIAAALDNSANGLAFDAWAANNGFTVEETASVSTAIPTFTESAQADFVAAAIGNYGTTFSNNSGSGGVNSLSVIASYASSGPPPGTGTQLLPLPFPRKLPWILDKPTITEGRHLFVK